jgi:hypothetical protein
MSFPANAIGLAAGAGAGYQYARNGFDWIVILLIAIAAFFGLILS